MWPMEGVPQSSLDWLETHLYEHDLKIKTADTILGGTALGLHKVQYGNHIDVKINGEIAVQCALSNLAFAALYAVLFWGYGHFKLNQWSEG